MDSMTMNQAALCLDGLKAKNLNEIGLSIDLETPNNCAVGIFSIGIVPFSVETGEVFPEYGYYERADFTEALNLAGKHGDVGGTMHWWMQQSDAARMEVLGYVKDDARGRPIFAKGDSQKTFLSKIMYYLCKLKGCLATNGKLRPLGNSDLFDIGIFENTLRACGWEVSPETMPYKFWDTLDLRTAVYLASMCKGINVKKRRPREGTHHNALDDAAMQAHWFVDAAMYLKGDK